MIIRQRAFARAGLVGNPSDGYFGKTIAFIIRNFAARVTLWETPHFEIIPGTGDLTRFDTVGKFLREQRLTGYYGGMRLIKAAIKTYHDHAAAAGVKLDDRAFTIQYESDIPRLVGMAGSSAIVTAAMRALEAFYGYSIEKHLLPGVILSCENQELGISAGLQDRVIQVYEGIVMMDFDRELMTGRGYGNYEPLTLSEQPPIYVAYDPSRAEVSDVPHRNLRQLFEQGDAEVVGAMQQFRELTDRGRAALESGDWDTLHAVTNANFDLRTKIMPIAPENRRMVETARTVGASAKFSGSGGAICGVYRDGKQYSKLCDALASIGCTTFRPLIRDL